MEEIKVNDFVKLDDGTIGKYQINKNWINVVETNNKYIGFDIEKDVVKHSSNIIDLIEIDDYVNGKKVIGKFYEENLKVLVLDTKLNAKCRSKDIKTIVTKEKYMANCYKVGGEDE